MLGLKLGAPLRLIFEFLAGFLQDLDRFGIGHAAEVRTFHMAEALKEAPVDEAVEEFQLFRGIFKHVADDVLQHIFRQVHVVLQIRKCDLRLNHPELRRMARRVGILRAESGTEGIDVAESLGESLAVQLAGYGQVRGLAKEIL